MPVGLIEIQDEVNVRFLGVPRHLVEEAQAELSYYVPNFRFMPAYKENQGNWDGKIRLFSKTGKTYLNGVCGEVAGRCCQRPMKSVRHADRKHQ